MKAIQVTFDEELLRLLDADPDVQTKGRSAVLRRAAALYLKGREEERIRAAYQRAYEADGGADPELQGWEDEAAWPET